MPTKYSHFFSRFSTFTYLDYDVGVTYSYSGNRKTVEYTTTTAKSKKNKKEQENKQPIHKIKIYVIQNLYPQAPLIL